MFKLCVFVIAALTLGLQTAKGQLVGADDARPGEFRYYAFLRINNNFFCSGALISHKHILSAGHCVDTAIKHVNKSITALLGTNNATSGGTVYPIEGKTPHEKFVKKSATPVTDWMYDIGIFTLGRDAVLSSLVGILGLATRNDIKPNSRAVVVGAGYVKDGGPPSQVLQKLSVTIMSLSDCKSKLPETYEIDQAHICTYSGQDKGTCNGDSGAPLVQKDLAIGIVVGFTRPCGSGYPDFYADVSYYRTWIDGVMKQ